MAPVTSVEDAADRSWRVVITGCGTSHGNPLWGLREWWSDDPRDQRRRSGAALLGPRGQVILIDVGPDLAHQCRDPFRDWDGHRYPERSLDRCDGVLLTHVHADHSHGLNDLRHLFRLMNGTPIAMYGAREHLDELSAMFPYAFSAGPEAYRHARPGLIAAPLSDGVIVRIADLPVTMFAMEHGPAGRTSGFRCGDLAYLTDLKTLPTAATAHLLGLKILILDMLRAEPHPTHLCWDEAQALIARLRPARTVLTHMGPEVRYAAWCDRLPPDVTMAVDGWTAPFSVGAE